MQTSVDEMKAANQVTVDWKAGGVPQLDLSLVPESSVQSDVITQFKQTGAVVLRGTYCEWVDCLRAGLQRNLESPLDYAFPCDSTPEGQPGRYFDSYCNWLLIPEYFEYVTRSSAASVAGQLMQSEVVQFFHEHAFSKEPGTQQATPWHQDLPYYCLDGDQTVSLYIALDPMPAEVALRFVSGSHRWGQSFHPVSFFDGSKFATNGEVLETVPDIEGNPDRYKILAWDLEPGDCIAFAFGTLHGTTAGKVKNRRRAVSTRWLGDDVQYCERPVETSPPFPDIGLKPGDRMREDWFPVLWRRQQGSPPNSN